MILLAVDHMPGFDGILSFLVAAGCGCIGLLFSAVMLLSKIIWWKTYRPKARHWFVLTICFAPFLFMVVNSWLGFFSIGELDVVFLFYGGVFPVVFFGFVFFNEHQKRCKSRYSGKYFRKGF